MGPHTLIVINAVVLVILILGGEVVGFLGSRAEGGDGAENALAAVGVAFLVGWVSVSASAFFWFWYIILHFVFKWW